MGAMNRLGIYIFYDENGIVDRYVPYFLSNVRPLLTRLVVVCNGVVSKKGLNILKQYADDVYVRDNYGFDGMAVRYAIVEKYGWKKVEEYDCVVVMNDTFFGPFYPLEDLFRQMDQRRADLCGILAHTKKETENVNISVIPAFFYMMSQRLIKNQKWRCFWENLHGNNWTFSEAVSEYEYQLIPACEKTGLKWDAYLRSDRQNLGRIQDDFHYVNKAYELIQYYQYPFLKKKPIATTLDWNGFRNTDATSMRRAIRYIKENTDYDVDMIWENIIRKYDIASIKHGLQLTKIFWKKPQSDLDYSRNDVVILLKTEQLAWTDDYIIAIKNLSGKIPVVVYTTQAEIESKFSAQLRKDTFWIKAFGNYASFLKDVMELTKKYEYILYIDDSKLVNGARPIIEGRTLQQLMIRCMWNDDLYTSNITKEFEKEKRLGVGILPKTYHGEYIQNMQSRWEKVSCFPEIRKIWKDYGFYADIKGSTECANEYSIFWTRGSILRESCCFLLDGGEELISNSADIMGRIIPYIAQKQGFYTMDFLSVGCAEENYSNLQVLSMELLSGYKQYGVDVQEYSDLRFSGLLEFCRQHQRVYIYGAGVWGKKALNIMKRAHIKNINGFIVSDGQVHAQEIDGYWVRKLSNVKVDQDVGIVVAVRASQQQGICRNLEKKGLVNVFKMKVEI